MSLPPPREGEGREGEEGEDAAALVARADAARRAGESQAASALYARALTLMPVGASAHTGALRGLGTLALEAGQPAAALVLLERALAAAPLHPGTLTLLGEANRTLGRLEAAAGHFLAACNRSPGSPQPGIGLVETLLALHRPADAARAGLWMVGNARPRDSDTLPLRMAAARACLAAGRPAEAAEVLRHALDLGHGADAEAWLLLARAERARGRHQQAEAAARAAIAHAPRLAAAHVQLGIALTDQGKPVGGEIALRRARALAPADPLIAYDLATALAARDAFDEAEALFAEATEGRPGWADAWINLGVTRLRAARPAVLAEGALRRALALAPRSAEAAYNLAWALLLQGRWAEGWEHYEARWRLPGFSSPRRAFPVPAWDGAPAPGRTLLLHAEQGLGDAIQFLRYVAAARARVGAVVLEVPAPLVRLASTLGGVDEVVAAASPGDSGPPAGDSASLSQGIDLHAPLMSLPRLLGQPEPCGGEAPYLRVPPGCRVAPLPLGYRVGLVWAGSQDNRIDRYRSIPAAALVAAVAVPGVVPVALQMGARAAEAAALSPLVQVPLVQVMQTVRDLADTAALLLHLDLVVTVDTAVAHLAGALGVPTWLLLPAAPDWRWGESGTTTPWYASLRLVRQGEPGDWGGALASVREALEQVVMLPPA